MCLLLKFQDQQIMNLSIENVTLASENADEYRKKWQEAEEKTFKNPLIFVKK